MKLEVGMYVRTKKGIARITKLESDGNIAYTDKKDIYFGIDRPTGKLYFEIYDDGTVLKQPSFNIIDVLEVGDILVDDTNRKLEVLLIDNELMVMNTGLIYDNNYYLSIEDIKIKSIVTKEQFENMKYEVKE